MISVFKKISTFLILLGFLGSLQTAFADETINEKVATSHDDAKRDYDKSVRKSKKRYRDRTGQRDRLKDTSDTMKNAGQDVSDKAKEVQRKAD